MLAWDALIRLVLIVPVTVEITMRDGRSETERIEVMYGHPARPMTRTAQIEKFRRNCAAAARPIAPEAAERVIAAVARLESLSDVTDLVDDLVPARTRNGPRELDSVVSEIFLGFQAAKSR